jgi:hypothetical protein
LSDFPVLVLVSHAIHTIIPLRPAPRGLWVCSTLDKVDATMNSINEQRDIANEISETISNTNNLGVDIDEVRYVLG